MRFCFKAFIILTVFSSVAAADQENKLQKHKRVLLLMGSRFEISAVSGNEEHAQIAIDSAIVEIQRIETLISSWNPLSQTSLINNNAGLKAQKVDKELYDLIYRCKKISVLTDGIFDISFASINKLWKFDGSMTDLPASDELKNSIKLINYQNIILNPDLITVFLKEKSMKIGFGGIGKGYAANRAMKLMKKMGIKHGVVNAGGDLITWGNQADGSQWNIAINDPKDKNKTLGWLNISNQAVVTSGNYEKYVEFNGRRYSHIINPKNGMPAMHTKSVTVICPDAELADALATAVFILGENAGIELIDNLKDIECFLITEKDDLITSKNLHLNFQ